MKQSTIRTIRTAVQTLFAVAAAAPLLLTSLGVSISAGIGATVVTVSAVIARIHQIPEVSAALEKYLKIPQ